MTVYQSLVRGERFDAVIQKSVEFGAAAVVPVAAARSEVRLSAADAEKKRVRWQRIAQEAAKQCGRAYIPAVAPPVPFEKAVSEAGGTVFSATKTSARSICAMRLRGRRTGPNSAFSSVRRAAIRRRKPRLPSRSARTP